MPNKYIRTIGVLLLIIGLIGVRYFEDQLFYDPLIKYFHNFNQTFPEMNETKLYTHVSFRFMLNLLLTVCVVKMMFWNQKYVKFTIIVGIFSLILLLPLYAYQIQHHLSWGEMIFFYIRRFLIQPMLLILLVPCFYYQEVITKKATN